MFAKPVVVFEGSYRIERLSQGHFIEKGMNPFVTQPADIDAAVEFFSGITLFKPIAPVNFFGNQMVKG